MKNFQNTCKEFREKLYGTYDYCWGDAEWISDRLTAEQLTALLLDVRDGLSNIQQLILLSTQRVKWCELTKKIMDRLSQEQLTDVIKAQDDTGQNIAHLAASQNNVKVMGMVLNKLDPAQQIKVITEPDSSGCNAVYFAVEYDCIDILTMILGKMSEIEKQEAITKQDNHGINAVAAAVRAIARLDVSEASEYAANIIPVKLRKIKVLNMLLNQLTDELKVMAITRQDRRGRDTICWGAIQTTSETLNMLLELLPPNDKLSTASNAIYWAARYNRDETLQTLLNMQSLEDQRKIIKKPPSNGEPHIVLQAIKNDSSTTLNILLGKLKSNDRLDIIQQKDKFGRNALCSTTKQKQYTTLMILLDRLSDKKLEELITMPDNTGYSAVHWAAVGNLSEALEMLLSRLPETRRQELIIQHDDDGPNLVYISTEQNCGDTLKVLLHNLTNDQRTEAICHNFAEEASALHCAIKTHHETTLHTLLDELPEQTQVQVVQKRDSSGRNLVNWAVKLKHEKAVKIICEKLLKTHKAQLVKEQSSDGQNAIYWAAKYNLKNALEVLLEDLPEETQAKVILQHDNDGQSAVYWAARRNHEATLKMLLKKLSLTQRQVEAIKQEDSHGQNAVYWAARQNYDNVLTTLLDSLPNDEQIGVITKQDADGQTAVLWAAKRDYGKMLRMFLYKLPSEKKVEVITQKDGDGCNSIYWAVEHKMTETLTSLLSALPSIKLKLNAIAAENNLGINAICYAAGIRRNTLALKLFLDTIENEQDQVNMITKPGTTGHNPVGGAIAYGNVETLKFLLDKLSSHEQVKILKQLDGDKGNAISQTVKYNRDDQLKHLLSRIEPELQHELIKQQDQDGRNAVYWASRRQNDNALTMLLDSVAKSSSPAEIIVEHGSYNQNAVYWAARHSNEAAMNMLMAHLPPEKLAKAAQHQDYNGQSPIYWTVRNRDEAMLKMLLGHISNEQKINVCKQQDYEGKTVIYWGAKNDSLDIIKILMENVEGKQMEAIGQLDSNECNAIHWAVNEGNGKALKILLDSTQLSIDEQVSLVSQKDKNQQQNAVYWAAKCIYDRDGILRTLLDRFDKDQTAAIVKQRDINGQTALYAAVMNDNKGTVRLLIDTLSLTQQLDVIEQKDSKGHNVLTFALLENKMNTSSLILEYIMHSKVALTNILQPLTNYQALQHIIDRENQKALNLLVTHQREYVTKNISRLCSNEALTRDQIEMLFPLADTYIIPYNQRKCKKMALIFHNMEHCTSNDEAKSVSDHDYDWVRSIDDQLSSAEFSVRSLPWSDIADIEKSLEKHLGEIRNQCSLLIICVLAHHISLTDSNQILLLVQHGLTEEPETPSNIPKIFLLAAGTSDSSEGIRCAQPNTVLLMSISESDSDESFKYAGAVSEEIGQADGSKTINSIHSLAVHKMRKRCPDVALKTPEYREYLNRDLVLPPVQEKPATEEEVQSADEIEPVKNLDSILKLLRQNSSKTEYQPIPHGMKERLTRLCEDWSVGFPVFIQSPDNWKEILILGSCAGSIDESELKKQVEGSVFTVKTQNGDGPLHTFLLTHDSPLEVQKKEWNFAHNNGKWKLQERATCELLVEADQQNKENSHSDPQCDVYLVIPAHMLIEKHRRNGLAGSSRMETAQEGVEIATTRSRYIVTVAGEQRALDLNHPPLLTYRYWCSERQENGVAPQSNINRASSPPSLKCPSPSDDKCKTSDDELCPHMIIADIALLQLDTADARDLQKKIRESQKFRVGPIFDIPTQKSLSYISEKQIPISVGKAEGHLWPGVVFPDGYGLHIAFVLKADTNGIIHTLEEGDCGLIVYCKESDEMRRPLGIFIGRAKTPFVLYQAVILNQAIKGLEKCYPHHVKRVRPYNDEVQIANANNTDVPEISYPEESE